MKLLGGLTASRFLSRHWQKAPLLVRGAFPRWRDPVSPELLAGLACESHVESRLVHAPVRRGSRWQVEHGPFDVEHFHDLPASHWTLLVQGVDEHVAAVGKLLDSFSFLPRWRLDDVMVSYAVDGGGVGPHTDSYDVFLIQGRGRRRWQVAEHFDPAPIVGLDLRVLRRFTPEREWVTEPGDLLYLPPGVAHCGTALEPCLTFSVGFRAPALREVALDVANARIAQLGAERLYGDADLAGPVGPGSGLAAAEARRLARALRQTFRPPSAAEWTAALGRIASERKREADRPARPLTAEALERALLRGGRLRVAPGARLAWSRDEAHGVRLHADGSSHPLPAALAALARRLCAREPVTASALPRGRASRAAALHLLAALHGAGTLTRG
ncbi:MAG: cupin domain-containing protein [Vicinamibacteria bacterium]|nr:cupin domain-containing protein [Vicinamibacteria bacterium]